MSSKNNSTLIWKNFEDAGNMLAEFVKSCSNFQTEEYPASEHTPEGSDAMFVLVMNRTHEYRTLFRPLIRKMRNHLDYAHDFIRFAYVKITDPVVEQQLQEIESHYVQTAGLIEQLNEIIGDLYEEMADQMKFMNKVNQTPIAHRLVIERLQNILQLNEEHLRNVVIKIFSAMSTFVGLWQEKIGDRVSDSKADEYRLASLPIEELNGSKLYREATVEEKRHRQRSNIL